MSFENLDISGIPFFDDNIQQAKPTQSLRVDFNQNMAGSKKNAPYIPVYKEKTIGQKTNQITSTKYKTCDDTNSILNNLTQGQDEVVSNKTYQKTISVQKHCSTITEYPIEDMEEDVNINPTNPHDQITFVFSTSLIDSGFLGDESGINLLNKVGPEFFKDNSESIPKMYYKNLISSSLPYDTINFTTDAQLNNLRIYHPLILKGNGSNTLYIGDCIEIMYSKDRFKDSDNSFKKIKSKMKNLEEVTLVKTKNRVIFENLKIVWKIEDSVLRQLNKESRAGDTKILIYLFNDVQIEFIDCYIQNDNNSGTMNKEGIWSGKVIKDTSKLKLICFGSKFDTTSSIFLQTTAFEGFSTLKTNKINNLVIYQCYFTKFVYSVLELTQKDDLCFYGSKFMYLDCPGIVILFPEGHENAAGNAIYIYHCTFERNKQPSITVMQTNRTQVANSRIKIYKSHFYSNYSSNIVLSKTNLETLEITNSDFLKNKSNCCIHSTFAHNLVMHSNIFRNNYDCGLYLKNTQGKFSKNSFDGMKFGVVLNNINESLLKKHCNIDSEFIDCTFSNCALAGIHFNGVALASMKIIKGNFQSCYHGIFVSENKCKGELEKYYKKKVLEIIGINILDSKDAGIAIESLYSPVKLGDGMIRSNTRSSVVVKDLLFLKKIEYDFTFKISKLDTNPDLQPLNRISEKRREVEPNGKVDQNCTLI